MNKGKYIVIEGAEGVGKTTMIHKLADQLRAAHLPVHILHEPDSQNDLTAREIGQLTQNPEFPMNTRTEVLLHNAARSQSLEAIRRLRENGVNCLVDRNYLTTLAIQYYGRGDVQDYQKINDIITFAVGDMEPDLTIVLDTPVATLKERTKDRYAGDRFDSLDEAFFERVRAGYLWEAKQRGIPVVYASDDIETVFQYVWQYAAPLLAVRENSKTTKPQSVAEVLAASPPAKANAAEPPITESVVKKDSKKAKAESPQRSSTENPKDSQQQKPWTQKNDNGSISITKAGREELSKFITNTDGQVYGFTNALPPTTIAAAMARLSRSGDDMRATLLDEFIGKSDTDEQLLRRVITAYGDDSVQQLAGQYIVVENASNLLTKKLEWGRLAAYLEQSTRYIFFDQKDADGHYRFYIPNEIRGKLRSQYIRTMNQIFDTYSKLVTDLTVHIRATSSTAAKERDAAWRSATKAQACDAARSLLPIATTSTVGIYASCQAVEGMIMRLLSDELPEARRVGQQILEESRKANAAFFERADKPDRVGALIAYRANTRSSVKQLAESLLPPNHTSESNPVTLVDYSPHNELSIAADILYEFSDLPLELLQKEVANWPYQRKVDVLIAYCGERLNRRQRPGRALEKIHYSFDLVCDYSIFRDLQRHRMVDDLEWQSLSPRLGYDVPKLVDEAGFADAYEQCFDASLQLFSSLQSGGFPLEAQYATLLGHKMRWKVTYNAREAFHLHELRTSPQGHPGYRKLVREMHTKIAEVHPLIADAMRYVNKGEDPELTRLAAERYAQYKIGKLDSIKEVK